jgi:hypothetical protein
MSTAKQIAANRRNAQKATGPRTAAGKAASRFNSLKHGLYATSQFIFDETAEDLAELSAAYHEHHIPADPEEHFLVETLVASEWRLRRLRRVETHMWECANITVQFKNLVKGIIGGPDPCSSGDAFLTASTGFERHQRIVNSCERDFHRALKDLEARAASRTAPSMCDRPPGLLPADARGAGAPMSKNAGQALAAGNSASQPQQSTPSSANLVSLQQDPPAAAKSLAASPSESFAAKESSDAHCVR